MLNSKRKNPEFFENKGPFTLHCTHLGVSLDRPIEPCARPSKIFFGQIENRWPRHGWTNTDKQSYNMKFRSSCFAILHRIPEVSFRMLRIDLTKATYFHSSAMGIKTAPWTQIGSREEKMKKEKRKRGQVLMTCW